jgi:hypothetical protein
MPMDPVPRGEPISKHEFHRRLRAWFATGEKTIGPSGIDERTAWVYIKDGDWVYQLHVDAHREAVEAYLELVNRYGDDLEWRLVPSRSGKTTAVGFGPSAERPEPVLYLYFYGPA